MDQYLQQFCAFICIVGSKYVWLPSADAFGRAKQYGEYVRAIVPSTKDNAAHKLNTIKVY